MESINVNRKIEARIDLKKVSEVGDVSLGDDVVVVIRGKITSMRGPEENLYTDIKGKEKKEVWPGSICVEVAKMSVNPEGEFDGLLED